MTKEEIEQAEKFLDAYLGGNRNVSTLTWNHWVECLHDYGNKLQSENERLKAELLGNPEQLKAESKLTEYKLLAGEACFETLSKVNDAWPDVAESECKIVTADYLYKDWLKATKRSGSVLLGSSVRDFIQYLDSHFKITTTP